MRYFAVRLSGAGISYAVEDGSDPVIGFFTTRWVRAADVEEAGQDAMKLVLFDWLQDGKYAAGNTGRVPTLSVEDAWPIGILSGIFGRRPAGYTFYSRDD